MSDKLKVNEAQYIKYTPKDTFQSENASSQAKIIKMQHVQIDPFQPARHKHKKVAPGPGSPPPVIMRSPPRKLTSKDELDWKVPPCLSNWKNAKGYTIPIEMRLSADGRQLKQLTVNERHSQNVNALYMAERQARQELDERNKILQSISYKKFLLEEEEMRIKAKEAREEKNKLLLEMAEQTEEQKRTRD